MVVCHSSTIYINNLPCNIPGNVGVDVEDISAWEMIAALMEPSVDHAKWWSINCSLQINYDERVSKSFGSAQAQ